MDKKDKLDQMQSRLNITEMDKNSKKDLFNKFESAGGKVINLDGKDPVPDPQKSNTTLRNVKVGNHSVRPSQENINPFADTGTHVTVVTQAKAKNNTVPEMKKISGFQVFLVRLTCMFANIFNFRDYIAKKELFHEYEMAYHTYNMLDEQWFINLKSTMPTSVDRAETIFKLIYARLFIFYPYYTRMQMGTNIMAQNYEKCFGKKLHNSYTSKKINDIFTSIWVEWYMWLEELMNYYLVRHNSKNPYQILKEFLNITPESVVRIGQFSVELKAFYSKKKEEELLEEDKDTNPFPSDEIQRGIKFIKEEVDFPQYMESFENARDLRSFFSPTDQLFYAYVLADYFDKEYTIWNDISFYIIPGGSTGRFDAKKEIKILTNQLGQFYEQVNEYLRFLRTTGIVKNIKEGQAVDVKKEKEMSRTSFAIRQNLSTIFDQFSTLLTQIINSKGTNNDMVGNRDDVLLNTKIHEDRMLYGKTVEEMLNSAQDYISAIVWLLKNSDLSGLSGKATNMKILTNQLINDLDNENTNPKKGL